MTRKIPLVQTQDQHINQLQQNIRNAVEPYMVTDNIIVGLQNNDSSNTGITAFATSTFGIIDSITVAPGTWDLYASVCLSANGATVTNAAIGFSTTDNIATDPLLTYGLNYVFSSVSGNASLSIPSYLVNIIGPTSKTFNLFARIDHSSGSPLWYPVIKARQVAGAPSGS